MNMMANRTYTDSASLNPSVAPRVNQARLSQYEKFAAAFSYPEKDFFAYFPGQEKAKDGLLCEYDRLFRSNAVWLYGSEYKIENEFQRVRDLAEISGFYRAFGLETRNDRPDALPCELEFMRYLIFKEMHAPSREKVFICRDAQKKFFKEHLHTAVKNIAGKILSLTGNDFYRRTTSDLMEFLKREEGFLEKG